MHVRLYTQNIWGGFDKTQRIANRHDLIDSLIRRYGPDICHFQECEPHTSRAEIAP